jgi:predicted PurR-regulated permease PerM
MTKEYPFYIKSTTVLLGLVLATFILFSLGDVLIPLSFSLMLAILLNPLTNKLQRYKISRVWSIVISLVISMLAIALVGYFLVSQVAGFTNELPEFKKRILELSGQLQQTASETFGLDKNKQTQLLHDFQTSMKPFLGKTIGVIAGSLAMVFLLPVYTFLFLFYKPLVLNFLYEVFDNDKSKEVGKVLRQTNEAIQSYMVGLLIEAMIVAAMNVIALLLLGVKYALLLGVIGAILNVLPYIGGIIAITLPVLIATVTKDGYQTQIGIVLAYLVIQFIDNHFLIPRVVSSRVQINALVSIVIVLLGGALWGIPGMFLSIPFIGVLKVIFDRIPEMKPWGKLLGDEVPTRHKGENWNFSKRKKTAS